MGGRNIMTTGDNQLDKAVRKFPVTEYVPKALTILSPNAVWRVTGDFSYEEIIWESKDIPKPSKEEVMAKALELKNEYDNAEYARVRALEYPSIPEQLDLIYHGGIDVWKAAIDAVKEKYPKPTQ